MKILENFKEKIFLIKRVKGIDPINEARLIFYLARFSVDKKNRRIDLTIKVDNIVYRVVDIESLFITSPRYEAWMWKYLAPKQGEVFVDVGSHVGKYALRIAKMVGKNGKVLAVEANPENFEALRCGVYLNKLTNIFVFNIAAWNQKCYLPFYVPKFVNESSISLIGKGQGSVKRHCQTSISIHVPALALDELFNRLDINRIDWVKIDVEGAEYEVLTGFEQVIKRYKPKCIIESAVNTTDIIHFMEKLGYLSKELVENNFLFFPCGAKA